jgi:hypothetical protein
VRLLSCVVLAWAVLVSLCITNLVILAALGAYP